MRIISKEISKKLKKLGFINIPCQYYYEDDILHPTKAAYQSQPVTDIWIDTNCLGSDNISDAPYLNQTRDWILEKFNISIEPYSVWDASNNNFAGYQYNVYNNKPSYNFVWYWDWKITDKTVFESYDSALEKGINYVTDVLLTKINDDRK